jgi:penicillin amidase
LEAVAGTEGAGLLEAWNGVLGTDEPAATLFEFFLGEMATAVAKAKAPRSADWALGKGSIPLVPFSGFVVRRTSHLVRLMREQPPGWFPEGWPARIRAALDDAYAEIAKNHGLDPRGWAWGTVRTLTLKHPLGLRPPLDKAFNLGPIPYGGDANTINPAPVDPRDPSANPDFAVASLRMVMDVGDWEMSRFVLPGGQSGNPFSRHYADQLPLWEKGDAFPIAWSSSAVARSTRRTLVLEPLLD